MNDNALQNRATEIIKPLVPLDAEERVNRSFKQWNEIVRDHIRTETGLKLSDGDSRYAILVRYESLLKIQRGPYLAHRDWLKGDRRQIGETVRFTLIAPRSQGRILYDHWQGLMAETSRNLTRHSPFGD